MAKLDDEKFEALLASLCESGEFIKSIAWVLECAQQRIIVAASADLAARSKGGRA